MPIRQTERKERKRAKLNLELDFQNINFFKWINLNALHYFDRQFIAQRINRSKYDPFDNMPIKQTERKKIKRAKLNLELFIFLANIFL